MNTETREQKSIRSVLLYYLYNKSVKKVIVLYAVLSTSSDR